MSASDPSPEQLAAVAYALPWETTAAGSLVCRLSPRITLRVEELHGDHYPTAVLGTPEREHRFPGVARATVEEAQAAALRLATCGACALELLGRDVRRDLAAQRRGDRG
jgi:hypothetical protein